MPAVSGVASGAVTLEGRWSGVIPEPWKPKTPMPFRYKRPGDDDVTGSFTHHRTLKKRGVIRLYGKSDDGHRVTAEIRIP